MRSPWKNSFLTAVSQRFLFRFSAPCLIHARLIQYPFGVFTKTNRAFFSILYFQIGRSKKHMTTQKELKNSNKVKKISQESLRSISVKKIADARGNRTSSWESRTGQRF
jgi:hypothetical protein